MSTRYALGARLAPPDPCNYRVETFLPAALPVLPPELDLTPCLQAPRNQGQLGSCTGETVVTVYGYLETFGPGALHRLTSSMDAYMGGRSLEAPNPAPQDEGCSLQKVLEYARLMGLCLESDWPYIATATPGVPGPNAAVNRAKNKLKAYAALDLNKVPTAKAAILQFGALAVAGPIDLGWDTVALDGTITLTGKVAGGHAFGVIGWDDKREAWKVRNSWGADWGQAGCCWVPFGSGQVTEAYSAVQGFLSDGVTPAPPLPAFITVLQDWADKFGIHIPGRNS